MDLVTIICDGTMKAFAGIAIKPGMKGSDIDAAKAADAMRAVIKDRYDAVVGDLKEALDANISDPWLRQAVNVACVELANEAYKRYSA